ncbi:FAD-linked sulfhydryl oxidase erv2 [Schizosaccharomyces pombe]
MVDKDWRLFMPEIKSLPDREGQGRKPIEMMSTKHDNNTNNLMVNAYWKLIHTVVSNYPNRPTLDERDILRHYLFSSAITMPCGEYSVELQKILDVHPPQTSSRKAATTWACKVHNQLNEKMNQPKTSCDGFNERYVIGSPTYRESEAENVPERVQVINEDHDYSG